MVIDMNESRLRTVAQLRAFLDGTLEVQFCAPSNDVQRYGFLAGTGASKSCEEEVVRQLVELQRRADAVVPPRPLAHRRHARRDPRVRPRSCSTSGP